MNFPEKRAPDELKTKISRNIVPIPIKGTHIFLSNLSLAIYVIGSNQLGL